jgi:hypothetical protein
MAKVLRIVYLANSNRLIYKARLWLGDQALQPSAYQCGLGTSRSLLPSSRRFSADQKNAPNLGAFREPDLSA